MKNKSGKNSGQLLITSVIMLGGILLSATAVAGLLLRYQLRMTNDAANSAKALFAADAQLEWYSYCAQKNHSRLDNIKPPGGPNNPANVSLDCTLAGDSPTFDDGSVSALSSIEFTDNVVTNTRDGRILSEGFGGKATRAVETILPF